MYKIIILGPPLTGITTLINYLNEILSLPVLDMDEELIRLNNGKWPGNYPKINGRLIKQVIADVLGRDEVIFSGFFFGIEELKQARRKTLK